MDLLDRFNSVVKLYESQESERNLLAKNRDGLISEIDIRDKYDITMSKVLALFSQIATKQRDLLGTSVESIMTHGLRTVFPDAELEFCVEIGTRGDYPTMNFFVKDHGKDRDIMNGDGGGLANVCGFLLQILYICLLGGRFRKFILMDEALNNLSAGHRDNMGALLVDLVNKLDFQLLFITHQLEYEEFGGKVYRFQKDETGRTKAILC